ncbi:hypothetical protein [Pseudomonas alloputida]|uniref:hypothetical protein n=1 Tax=Pseudomonas alloputida TaxID=1940621 RepID=UPI001E52E4A3|nr:hypothetical protein [Pseudomonas alloputida]MCE1053389.1 hypothetical protein [Pseudomonas alloputida]
MRNYLKAVLMIVLVPAVVIAGSTMATLWFKFAVSLDLSLPAKLTLMFGPSILLAAIPIAWLMSKIEEKP